MSEITKVINFYSENIDNYQHEISEIEEQSKWYALARLATFILATILFIYGLFQQFFFLNFLAIIFYFLFFLVVKKQNVISKQLLKLNYLIKISRNEINNIQSHQNFFSSVCNEVDGTHIYSSDLEIFGKKSLYAQINRTITYHGNITLRKYLETKASKKDILRRQEAIIELREKKHWRASFLAYLLREEAPPIPDFFSQWEQWIKAPSVQLPTVLLLYIRALPFIFVGIIVLAYAIFPFLILLPVLCIINMFILRKWKYAFQNVQFLLNGQFKILNNYYVAINEVKKVNWESPFMQEIVQSFSNSEGDYPTEIIRKLRNKLAKLDLGNLSFQVLLNILFLRKIDIYSQLEKNRHQARFLDSAFEKIGHVESLISLATLSYNNPSWVFPAISDTYFSMEGKNIGNPLINAQERITNDFSIGHSGAIDIITGSNMSGKSTFLRSIGINIILALSGSPVCATAFKVSSVHLLTLMKITDSQVDNLSTFQAEINRLGEIIKFIQEHPNTYVILDEILRGTNSDDKFKGTQAVINKLLKHNISGIVATHDLRLTEMKNVHPANIRNYYFDIQIIEDEMSFDYILKKGICKNFNAYKMLKNIGVYE